MTPDALAIASAVVLLASLLGLFVLKVFFPAGPRKAAISGASDVSDKDVKLTVEVHYGTQTGTSERFAREVEEEIKRRYGREVRVRTSDLEHITADTAEDVLLKVGAEHEIVHLFLQSTYGDGEPTDTSADFVHWLRDTAEDGRMPDLLSTITYSVFGLGNSCYEHYNAAAKLVDKSLHALGADRLMKIYLGDDDNTLEDDFHSWREALWSALETKYGIAGEAGSSSIEGQAPAYQVAISTLQDALTGELFVRSAHAKRPEGGITSQSSPYAATVTRARELHSSASDRSCVHIEFDISDTGITYSHGDHLGVYAENSFAVVKRAAACLRLPLDHAFTLSVPPDAPASLALPFHTPCTLGTALAKYSDLLSSPRKVALAALASVASDPEEQSRLKHLASTAGKQDYSTYIVDSARSLLEVLEDFPSAVPPLGLFFGAVSTRLAPRFYSISSSPLHNPGIVTATVAVVRGKTPTGRMHNGVASTFLSRFVPDDSGDSNESINPDMFDKKVSIFLRTSTFKLPKDPSVPVIMIGPGTGYAPFRGFLQERAALAKSGASLGLAHLFFGCRHEEQDYIYREEMESAEATRNVSSLSVAFSRATPGRKIYVQDKLALAARELYPVIKGSVGANDGRIYVCGDAKGMARDVHRALHSILMSEGGYAGHEAEEIVKRLTDTGRYHKDVW